MATPTTNHENSKEQSAYAASASKSPSLGEQDHDVEKAAGEISANKSATAGDDPNVISWDPDDPDHPLNFPRGKMLLNLFWVASLTFISPLGSSIFAPAVPEIMKQFNSSNNVLECLVVSVYLLGYASGPLLTAPLSELYGRLPVYHASNIGFIAFSVGCALAPNLNALIVFRFFSGSFGATPMTNGGGSVGDMIRPEKRAKAMSGYLLGPLLGPVVGPIIGGFLSESAGWRWCFWLLAIVSGAVEIGMLTSMDETYHPILLRRKVAKMRKDTGNMQLRSALDKEPKSPAAVFRLALVRPLRILFLSPVVSLVSFWVSLAYGYTYIMFTSISPVMEETYGFKTDLVGLTYIGIGAGTFVGMFVYSGTADKYLKRKSAAADAAAKAAGRPEEGLKPEFRLFLLPLGVILLPVGLFLYGWPAQYHVHWIVPVIGTAIVGCSFNLLMISVMTYLIDAFKIHAASALAASTVLRSVAGGLLPIAALPLYDALGLGWGNSLLAFIAIALAPTSILILKYGEFLRKKYEIQDL